MKTLPIMLVISSSISIQKFFSENFLSHFSIQAFSTPENAFESTKNIECKVVILDGKEHESSLSKIRKYFPSKNTRIFVISNEIRKNFLEKALQAGVDDFLQLPLLKEEIEEKMALAPHKQTIRSKVEEIQRKSLEKSEKKISLSPHLFSYPKEVPSSLLFPGCLIYIEVDNFAQMTENEDSSTVENFSDLLSSFLSMQLRSNDKLLFYSPESYALFLGKTSQEEGLSIAQNLQKGIAKHRFHPLQFSVSVSMVIASIQKKPGHPLEEIKKILEQAKATLDVSSKQSNRLITL